MSFNPRFDCGTFLRRRLLSSVIVIAGGFLLAPLPPPTVAVHADENIDTDQSKKARAARIEVMRRHAASMSVQVKVAGAYVEAEILDVPLLHYNNPAGETLDATVWGWGRRGRPAALASISHEKSDSRIEKWSCELVSLTDAPILLTGRPGWQWAPAASGIEWKRITDAPVVGETEVVRTRQMNEIARRFSGRGIYRDAAETIELRLMVRPLSRYSDAEHGLIDGAIFAFAGGTNPEVLLMVECRTTNGENHWYQGFARLGAGRLVAQLGEAVIWERPEIKTWNRAEPYFSAFGPVDSVFGTEPGASK